MSQLVWMEPYTETLSASGNVDRVAPNGNPTHVCTQLSKTGGAGSVTGVTVRRSLDGGTTWGAPRVVSSGLPLGAVGDALDVDLVDELVTALRFELTVSGTVDVALVIRGERR